MANRTFAELRIDNFITRSIVRLVALHTPLIWPKGTKTVPEADQEQDGTKPAEWDRDLADLLRRIDAFVPADGERVERVGLSPCGPPLAAVRTLEAVTKHRTITVAAR